MTTKSAENTSLEIKRFINAPPARVYAAWTDPAQLKEWFGPVWVRTCELVAEPRVGGKFRWDVINCDGKEVTIQGEYRELVPGKKIVFTWKHCGRRALGKSNQHRHGGNFRSQRRNRVTIEERATAG